MFTLDELEDMCGCPIEVIAVFDPENPEENFDIEEDRKTNKQNKPKGPKRPAGFATKATK